MNRFFGSIALFLMLDLLLLSCPIHAAKLDTMGLTLPSVQSVGLSDAIATARPLDSVMERPIDPNTYHLGPGDQLETHVIVGDSELSVDRMMTVGADGKVFFPNIGEISVSGLSLTQAKARIDSQIRSAYKEPFKLYILLSQPKKVKIYLSGMVKNPGPAIVYDGSRISEVLDQAGGIASGGSNRYIYIRRKGDDGKEQLLKSDLFEAYRSKDLSKDLVIVAGDIVEVPDSDNVLISQYQDKGNNDKLLFEGKETFVFIYGEVAKGGRFEFIPGKKLSDYLSYAGGPTGRALLGGVTITRQVEGKAQKYSVDASDILYNGNSKNDAEILGGDVINVPGNFFYFSDFSSFANMLFTGLALYNTFVK
ncbi:MAG TPA: polysaccharide biosynthesis/export family protein [Candidatus Omnitrophota bacterium]|nr:polysaccharide biosynthesis/export family protein [Candidatus Omnitrophota bacterium]